MRCHTLPYAATRSHTQPYAAIRSHTQPCAAIRSCTQPHAAIRSQNQYLFYVVRRAVYGCARLRSAAGMGAHGCVWLRMAACGCVLLRSSAYDTANQSWRYWLHMPIRRCAILQGATCTYLFSRIADQFLAIYLMHIYLNNTNKAFQNISK